MNKTEILKLATKQNWAKGSVWEFDLYIDKLFVEKMAYGDYPIKISYFQPILDDEFLNTSVNNNLLNRFEHLLEDETKIKELLLNQSKIINDSTVFLENLKSDYSKLDYEVYAKLQGELSLLMASVSVVVDPLISDYLQKISENYNIPLEKLSAHIINNSSVTALNKSNESLINFYEEHKQELDTTINNNDKLDIKAEQFLAKHAAKYGWINTGEKGRRPWTTEDFFEQLKELRDVERPEIVILDEQIKNKLKNIIQININDNVAADIQVELDYIFQHYLMRSFGDDYSEETFENLTLEEIEDLDSKKLECSMFRGRQTKHKLIIPIDNSAIVVWLDTSDYKDILQTLKQEQDTSAIFTVTGRPACIGIVEGKARIVKNQKDLEKFEKGYILVAEKTQPSYVMAMKKALAIVTDIGGITSHAAIVSRELGIPCVVATGNGTSIIKNDDIIRVDAEKGIVEILVRAN